MRSTFFGIEMSKKSLFTQQAALTTTGHNISNANTQGYSRQVVNMVASKPLEPLMMSRSASPGQVGQGVEFDQIKRIREKFLDDQFHHESKFLGEWTIRRDTLDKIEAIINEPSDTGIRQVLENFWNSWQDLSKEPDNLTARAVVKERTMSLVDALNYSATQLRDLSTDLTNSVRVKVTEMNTFIFQIAELNSAIYRIEGLGDQANDLRDQRDLLLDKLAKISNITMQEDQFGFNVKMGDIELVRGKEIKKTITFEEMDSLRDQGHINSGEVFGMMYARDNIVSNYRTQLDALAKTLATGKTKTTLPKGTVIPEGAVINGVTYTGSILDRTLPNTLNIEVDGLNGLHKLGYSLTKTLHSGEGFFATSDGSDEITAANITLNSMIYEDVRYISSSFRTYMDGSAEKVVGGNADLALAIAGMRNMTFDFDPEQNKNMILSDGTFEEFYRSAIGQIGVQSQEANRQAENQKVLVEQVESRRQSISGVSLDEEMANMMKFQHAYNAAARALTTFDEMLDRVINNMGQVGR